MLTAVQQGATKKTTLGDTDDCRLTNFGQQRLNGAANWSVAEDGRVLPHFQQIVSGVLMPLCLIVAVF